MNAASNLGKRALAWIVLIALALLSLKIIAAIFFGFLQALFMIVLIAGAFVVLFWALRHL
jgi:hypothetical protein